LSINNEFDCPFCNQKHTPLEATGFPVDQSVLTLLNEKNKNASRSSNVEKLKAKLTEVKAECDNYTKKSETGIVAINEHCVLLRNKVHLATEMMIEKVLEFNGSLLAEINRHENTSIESFLIEKEKMSQEIKVNISKFHVDTTQYISESERDDKIVEKSLVNVAKMIKDLTSENDVSKYTNIEFIRNDDPIDNRLLGYFTEKSASGLSMLRNLVWVDLTKVVTKFRSNLHIFTIEDGNYAAFYVDQNYSLICKTFDKNGLVLTHCSDIVDVLVNKVNVVQKDDMFVIVVSLMQSYDHLFIRGYKKIQCFDATTDGNCNNFMISLDKDLQFLNFIKLKCAIRFLTASKSKILCIEPDQPCLSPICLLYNTSLHFEKIRPLTYPVLDVKIDEKYIYFLCTQNKLRIHVVDDYTCVQVIDTNANQIQLLTSNSFVLYNSSTRLIHKYFQCGLVFEKSDCLDLAQPLEYNLKMCCDGFSNFLFYNSDFMRYSVVGGELELLPNECLEVASGSEDVSGQKSYSTALGIAKMLSDFIQGFRGPGNFK
jgi:hypothetical protein